MKIAIAQIDMRLGDIEAICARIESQALLAHAQGARLVCTPVPLFAGVFPGELIEAENYVHDVLSGLDELAKRLEKAGIWALVPAFVSHEGSPVLETFLLKEGHVIPLRSLVAIGRERAGEEDIWMPPIFDIDGIRCAVSFDAGRDIELLPPGCDAVIYFQTQPFSIAREETAAVAAVTDGHMRPAVIKRSVWLACVTPIGGFDGALYTGGSYVMDDCGRVVAAAPCFEEALVVQDVQRGIALPCIEDHELPRFDREEWLWGALRLGLSDAAAARGRTGAALVLSGDLPSSLVAALCVDAFGPRNVTGLLVHRHRAFTPEQERSELERVERVRMLAALLHIRLVERDEPDLAALLDRDEASPMATSRAAALRAASQMEQIYLGDIADAACALPVSSLTKTDYALASEGLAAGLPGEVAPFGDVYLTELEFVARVRNRAGASLPAPLVSLRAVEAYLDEVVARAVAFGAPQRTYVERAARLLAAFEPNQLDGILEAHVDRGLAFEDIPFVAAKPDAVALVLMLVRQGEAARRTLPPAPAVSARSFTERAWPVDLAWSDLGRRGAERHDLAELARDEIKRFEARGEEVGERMRGELIGLVGNLLGIDPEQLEALSSEEGRQQLGERLPKLEDQVQRAMRSFFEGGDGASEGGMLPFPAADRRGFTFFSQN